MFLVIRRCNHFLLFISQYLIRNNYQLSRHLGVLSGNVRHARICNVKWNNLFPHRNSKAVPTKISRFFFSKWKAPKVLLFWTECSNQKLVFSFLQSHLWYQLHNFAAVFRLMEMICSLNGKCDSRKNFPSPGFCIPFAQTLNRPVCPHKW